MNVALPFNLTVATQAVTTLSKCVTIMGMQRATSQLLHVLFYPVTVISQHSMINKYRTDL